eukprot:10512108-Alexandrium_andersonii.AAC.1
MSAMHPHGHSATKHSKEQRQRIKPQGQERPTVARRGNPHGGPRPSRTHRTRGGGSVASRCSMTVAMCQQAHARHHCVNAAMTAAAASRPDPSPRTHTGLCQDLKGPWTLAALMA